MNFPYFKNVVNTVTNKNSEKTAQIVDEAVRITVQNITLTAYQS